jgi:hypothetical protein
MTRSTTARGAGAFPLLLAGAVSGVLLFGVARLAFVPEHEHVHFHANFAMVVDGQRFDFSPPRYMQDVAACQADPARIAPEQRVHLHNSDPDVVHVHHAGVTWGHFLTNLGFGTGDGYLVTDDGTWHRTEGERTLRFVMNGHPVPDVHNRLIRPGDRLLISHGPEDAEEVVEQHFSQVASNAPAFDTLPDPAGCSGPQQQPWSDRIKQAFWF